MASFTCRIWHVTLLSAAVSGGSPSTPNSIFKASELMVPVNSTSNGKLLAVNSNGISLKILHAFGTPEEMGRAQGRLLGLEAHEFLTKAIPQFIEAELSQINISKLPSWVQKAVVGKAGEDFVEALLAAVYIKEEKYISGSQSSPLDEMRGFAEGVCESGAVSGCDVERLLTSIKQLNMIPELIRMTCSMFGAYGSATLTGDLLQLRSLDFGDGPFANYTVITVRHPQEGNPFVSVAFPSMVAAITGFSTKVGISEKVWETYVGSGVQPGAFDGEPDAMVLRDILQFSNSRSEAIEFTQHIHRTWAIFIGVGDFQSQKFNALGYREKDLQVFDPLNISLVTHEQVIADVVYIDKHPQPSHDNTTMPNLMMKYHGKLDGPTTAQYIPRVMQSGDLHVGIYDYGARKAWVASGQVTAEGKYGPDDISGKACNQPYLEFDMDTDFFNVKQ